MLHFGFPLIDMEHSLLILGDPRIGGDAAFTLWGSANDVVVE